MEGNGRWEIIVLGCGSSSAVPKISCRLSGAKCACNQTPQAPQNVRLNPSILIRKVFSSPTPSGRTDFNILVDCGKTFRESALKYFPMHGIRWVDAVVLTHIHSDAIMGLDDLREVQSTTTPVTLYANANTLQRVRECFPYFFQESSLWTTRCNTIEITDFTPFTIVDLEFIPVPLYHGGCICLGFILNPSDEPNQFAYFSDFAIPQIQYERECSQEEVLSCFIDIQKTLPFLMKKRLSAVILDCLHETSTKPHKSHASLRDDLKLIEVLRDLGIITSYFLTGMACDMNYLTLNSALPPNIQMLFDGQLLDFQYRL
jgi:phosphoribosyl 1,2-cyclic phosphodiesterase